MPRTATNLDGLRRQLTAARLRGDHVEASRHQRAILDAQTRAFDERHVELDAGSR